MRLNAQVKKLMNNISDEELFNAYKELEEFQESGQLKQDGICRKYFELVYPDYRERHIPLWAIQNVFYIEIAHRWAKNQ